MEFLFQEVENLAFRECEPNAAVLACVFLLGHERNRVSQAIRWNAGQVEVEWFFAHI
jgi:hypothetical protein